MTAKNTNPVPGAKARYLAASERAAAKEVDPAKLAKSQQNREYYAASKIQVPAICAHGTVSSISKTKICEKCRDSIRWTGRVPSGLSEEASEAVQKILPLIPRAKNRAERAAEREAAASAQKAVEADQLSKPWQQDPKQHGSAAEIKTALEAMTGKPTKVAPQEPTLPEGVNIADPVQRAYLANAIVLRGLNYEAGVRDALPKLKPYEVAVVAAELQKDRTFQLDIQTAASARGLGEEDRKIFLGRLWHYVMSNRPQDYQDRSTAFRILGRAFIGDGKSNGLEKPAPLQVEGFEAGIARMGIDLASAQNLPIDPVEVPDLEEYGEEDPGE